MSKTARLRGKKSEGTSLINQPDPFENISLKDIPQILPLLSVAEQEQLLAQLSHLEKLKHKSLVQEKFIEFVKYVWPSFISGRDRKSTRLNSSHCSRSRMPSSA